jgi:hypothetical protein
MGATWGISGDVCLNRVCDVLCGITSVMAPRNDPDQD